MTIVNVGGLWWLTHLQLGCAMVLGYPFYLGPSDIALAYYVPTPAFGLSPSELFLVITLIASATVILAVRLYTRGTNGHRRMFFLAILAGILASSFSLFLWSGGPVVYSISRSMVDAYLLDPADEVMTYNAGWAWDLVEAYEEKHFPYRPPSPFPPPPPPW